MFNKAIDCLVKGILLLVLVIFLGLVSLPMFARAQDMLHRHALGHGEYTEWQSGKTLNCCNKMLQ